MAEPKTTTSARAQAGKPPTRQDRKREQKEKDHDLETLVSELEARVDRLRASYDQYFMGIEKLPPHVQIKDVERRLQDLRKIQIRNTALRFKFQTTLQKYNTYQSYWQRIVRQIEEGTYKRDLRRAAERFGVNPRRPAAAEIEIDVEFEDMMSEDADLDELLSSVSPARGDDDAPDTIRPSSPEPHFEMPPIPRSDDSRRLMALDDPDAGIPVYLPRGPIEERPSQRHLARAEGKAVLPAIAAPPKSGRTLVTGPIQPPPPSAPAQKQQVPVPAPSGTSKRKSTAPPKDGSARPSRKSSRPAAQPAAAKGAPQPAKPRREGELSDERLRQLYSQYVEMKRTQKESTAALSYDSLARSLIESSEKLKEKHVGKKVDFEVAVKDGRTILRPVVK